MNAYESAEHVLRELIESLKPYIPEKNCTCWLIQAPCDDCIEHAHEREAVEAGKRAIGKLQAAAGYLPIQR